MSQSEHAYAAALLIPGLNAEQQEAVAALYDAQYTEGYNDGRATAFHDLRRNLHKPFRNLLFNELGVTKEDVRQWTQDAVTEVATRWLHNNEQDAIRLLSSQCLNVAGNVVPVVGRELAKRIQITILRAQESADGD